MPATRNWGGAREGAGRPKRRAIASERHHTRPHVSPRFPVHVTCRITAPVRIGAHTDAALQLAQRKALARADFKILELALRGRQVELVVHADDKVALARGMQGFQVSAARAVNRALGRSGQVFADRYRVAPDDSGRASRGARRRRAE